ncbi:CPBP family intramembrane glutamic endopeptidase [Tropicimonas marinistellae]|uniref:CPBP family intramembrane glutamic endopeptidase n=1 Tax=Tropicimonas marinistellae TaxID=1739787 RepID=UPI00082F0B3E|nr:CPBP family intramembrane glutamic endopeptidase [Tropicimonas marinistellae]
MKIKPRLATAAIVYVIYTLVIFGTWFATDANYLTLTDPDRIATTTVLPLFFGAIFLAATLSYLGWWRPVMTEDRRGGPGWTLWGILVVTGGFILLNLTAADWSQIAATHLTFLFLAAILVGFNEEALTRGVLVVGGRGSTQSETLVWFVSSLLFGLMHLPNALFGLPPFAAVAQVGFAFLAGSGFYLLRRLSGTILLPMFVHAAWDFSTFSKAASGAEGSSLITLFQFGTYIVSIILVILVLRRDRGSPNSRRP